MGIIQKQALRSSFFLLLGFLIGGINIVILFPKLVSLQVNGLTRAMIELSTILSVLSTFGSLPLIFKFSPFYRSHLSKEKNDLPALTGMICLAGFLLICAAGYIFRDFILRKLGKSPLLADHFNLVYLFTFLLVLFAWMEAFSWSLKRTVESNFLKETLVRILTTILLVVFGLHWINEGQFINLFSVIYIIPVIILFIILKRTGEWSFHFSLSKVSRRFGKKMFTFAMFTFGATFLNVASRTVDSIVVMGLKGLDATAVFSLAVYLAALMDLPMRSLVSIATPVLSESWKEKKLGNIFSVYKKSTITLLTAAVFIFCLVVLNVHNLASFLGKDFAEIPEVVFVMGLARVIDLGTGVNGQIITTSTNWRFDFFTNVFLTILAFPLNYILITRMGIVGGAYATLISTSIFNLIRFIFIYRKYGWQPYGFPHLKIILVATIIFIAVKAVPFISNIYVDTVFRAALFAGLFAPAILRMNISEEFNAIAAGFSKRMRLRK